MNDTITSAGARLREILTIDIATPDSQIYEKMVMKLGLRDKLGSVSPTRVKLLPSGADSKAIIYVDCNNPYVLKIGPSAIISNEITFLQAANYAFPKVFDQGIFRDDLWYAMEAADPSLTEDLVFENRHAGLLLPNWFSVVREMASDLRMMMDETLVDHECQIARYHYTRRINAICDRSDFLKFAEKSLQSAERVNHILDSGFILNGKAVRGILAYSGAVANFLNKFRARKAARIHGDFHLKNVLRRRHGGSFLLIDPRLQWDDLPFDKFGFGDPIYDASTMLHSVSTMTQILANIEAGTTRQLCALSLKSNDIEIELGEEFARQIAETTAIFLDRARELVPIASLTAGWDVRLLTGAANALLGWLKYETAIQTEAAWAATYSAATIFLQEASIRASTY